MKKIMQKFIYGKLLIFKYRTHCHLREYIRDNSWFTSLYRKKVV
jgi:hypothetical protein